MAKIRAHVPSYMPMFSSVAAPTNRTLTALNDYVSIITVAEEDAVIDRVTGYVDLLTGTPGTVRIGIQSVSTSTGLPSGTWLGYGDFSGTSGNFPNFNTKQWTLSTTASITRGQYYAIVFYAFSGTFDASNNVRFYTLRGTGIGPANLVFPYYHEIINGVSGTKTTTAGLYNFGCGTSTRQYGIATSGSTISAWNSGATPNQRGIKFNLPASLCTSFKVAGVRMAVGPTNSAAQWNLNLYNSSSTVLQNRTYTNSDAYNTNTIVVRDYYFDESTLTTLSPNTDYRIAVEAASASLGCLQYIETGGAWDVSSAFVPDGTFHLTTRSGTGAWTDTTTSWFPMQLIIDDFTASGGTGGAATEPRLRLNAGLN